MRRAVLAGALAALAAAAPAGGHASIASMSPRDGSTVPAALSAVVVTFKASPAAGSLRVTDARGRQVSVGKGRLDGKRLRVQVRGLGRGLHRVRTRWVASDGHPQVRRTTFRVR